VFLQHVPGSLFLRNLVYRRALLFQLVRRDFRQRYIGSAAGWVWGFIHPLVLLLSWFFVFQICLKVPLPADEVTQNYAVFLLCGFLPWLLFQETVQRSATSLVENANLITKTIFPAEVIPVAMFLSSLISHLFPLLLAVVVAGVMREIGPLALLLPLYIIPLGLFAIGIGWIVSSLHVYLRDTAQAVTVMLTLWFWMTPVLLSENQYPARLRFLLALNPLAYLARAYRDRLLSSRLPSIEDYAIITAFGVASFLVGGLFFRHVKRGFADVL